MTQPNAKTTATPIKKPPVLFICTGNTARSQMAQALLERRAGDRFEVSSAGLEPGVINPLTLSVLKEIGLNTEHLKAEGTRPLLGQHFQYVITVCHRAETNCPIFPFALHREAWPFEDPAAAQGREEDRQAVFRRVRDEIDARIQVWLSALAPVS
ncbi:protein-tyrosine-phosphatase [Deinococcus seoulensis]|uniref:Protein-tyrosine-phosphatase n=1 Tax=Deinococcus seoulensis TaxID=1837379 RepID=A0ABQ2RZY1_9DEIO|nr:arsenate reductase ArsC [Deinococcus seoulensis]GGR74265.1 protein-tyrosine-phosphatase [Deinococcus seoulensis]